MATGYLFHHNKMATIQHSWHKLKSFFSSTLYISSAKLSYLMPDYNNDNYLEKLLEDKKTVCITPMMGTEAQIEVDYPYDFGNRKLIAKNAKIAKFTNGVTAESAEFQGNSSSKKVFELLGTHIQHAYSDNANKIILKQNDVLETIKYNKYPGKKEIKDCPMLRDNKRTMEVISINTSVAPINEIKHYTVGA